ncbi:MAG: sensor histidine kinase [Eubacteriales bacterium]|nr:sensor histidine kinase [Clostridiales bacterium]MDD7302777.1 sensor histidine kinase [Eubacteriales bacterium]MDY4435932.1 sensor histidine kinase [Candidatus Flemingibacterium sp.]
MDTNEYSTKKMRLATLTAVAIIITVAAVVAVSIIPFVSIYSSTVESDAGMALEQSARQTTMALGNLIDGMEGRLLNICREVRKSEDITDLDDRLSVAARLEESIEAICVYDMEGNTLSVGGSGHELKDQSSINLSYDGELFGSAENFAISLPHVQTLFREYYPWVVTIARREEGALNGEDVYVAIDCRFSDISGYVDNIGIGAHGYCFIIDADGNLVYHPRQQMLYSGLIKEEVTRLTGMDDGTVRDGNVMRTILTLDSTGWRVIGVSYLDEVNATRDRTLSSVLLTTLLCCAGVAVLIAVIFSQIITKPVKSLIGAMRGFEEHPENYRYSPAPIHIAELQLISDSFGQMAWIVQSLMEKTRNEEALLRKTELKALQAQINPHFLYNTLDSIQWMCERGKNESAVRMVGALGKLFRISISRGHELIPIRDELKHVESYLIIQKYRYSDRFEYTFDVDESLGGYLCSKITLQPLVENAIYHGIEPLIDDGEIIISVKPDGDDILMTVSDNGVGMTAEQVEGLLKKERSDSSGIGIKNVSDRIKIYFGDSYGVKVESEPDVGTKITVRIPKITKEPD